MTAVLTHSGLMAGRWLRILWRQPWYVAITLVQPVIWLLLLPFRLVGIAVDGVFQFLRALFTLPARLLGARA